MSKRPAFDLTELTSDAAAPMPEATQRTAKPAARSAAPVPKPAKKPKGRGGEVVATADLEPLAFKVPPTFRKRFKACALQADLKLNELLFQSLDAWEAAHK